MVWVRLGWDRGQGKGISVRVGGGMAGCFSRNCKLVLTYEFYTIEGGGGGVGTFTSEIKLVMMNSVHLVHYHLMG